MRKFVLIAADVMLVVLSPFAALLIRDNFEPSAQSFEALLPYAGLTAASAILVFAVLRINRSVWRYTSLTDILRVIAAATLAILLAWSLGFALFRMDGISRSIPVVQWLLLLVGMSGNRVMVRLLLGRNPRRSHPNKNSEIAHHVEHVLVVGFSKVAQLYLDGSEEIGSGRVCVQGILADGDNLRGRRMQRYEVVGAPEDTKRIVKELMVRGVAVERILIAQAFATLSGKAREELLGLERSSTIKLDFFVERLGLKRSAGGDETTAGEAAAAISSGAPLGSAGNVQNAANMSMLGGYGPVKRAFDIVLALVLIVLLAPVLAFVCLLVILDLGRELVFWQQRPGHLGWPFRLYKLRTMSDGHDAGGNAVPDDLRMSTIGRFLRRTRLDELPQLYNILVGEMTFVGPRPLLWRDQVKGDYARLMVRPGLTGWAQVNGGRALSVEDKRALDLWYVQNASLWLDIKILANTVTMILFGEKIGAQAIHRAWMDLNHSTSPDNVFLPTHLSGKPDRLDVDHIHERAV